MTWIDGFMLELTWCCQTQSVAEYFNSPSLFIIIPK